MVIMEGLYFVDAIVGYRGSGVNIRYLVMWTDSEELTWEPKSNLVDCPERLREFQRKLDSDRKARARAREAGRPLPAPVFERWEDGSVVLIDRTRPPREIEVVVLEEGDEEEDDDDDVLIVEHRGPSSSAPERAVTPPVEEPVAEVAGDRLCRVCMVSQKDTVFMPCRHYVACARCAEMVLSLRNPAQRRCPFGRCPVSSIIKIFDV